MISGCSEKSEHLGGVVFAFSFPDNIIFLEALLFKLYSFSLPTVVVCKLRKLGSAFFNILKFPTEKFKVLAFSISVLRDLRCWVPNYVF